MRLKHSVKAASEPCLKFTFFTDRKQVSMFLPTRLPGRWSMRFTSSGIYDCPVSVCWDGERLSFSEGGKPHYFSAATINACTDWYWHGPEYSTIPILYSLPTSP